MLFHFPALTENDREVIDRIMQLRQALRYSTSDRRLWTGVLRRDALARAIQGSNSIEGYVVTLETAIAAARGEQVQEPADTSAETWAAITGYRNAMTYILQLADDAHFSYSEDLLRGLHFMMLSYDLSKHPGRWRPGYIAVRNDRTGEIVHEGPDVELVPALVRELVHDLELEEGPPLIRAAMAHLNLIMIHPFKDGNGRMARALQSLVLTREGILAPEFCSIEEYLGRNTQAYYQVLAEVGGGRWQPDRDAAPWVRFNLIAHYRQARTHQNRIDEASMIWQRVEDIVVKAGLPERAIFALFDAANGLRVHNSTYRASAEVSLPVASRDLKALVDRGLLEAVGEARGRYYLASDALHEIRAEARRTRRQIEDPYEALAASKDSRQLRVPF